MCMSLTHFISMFFYWWKKNFFFLKIVLLFVIGLRCTCYSWMGFIDNLSLRGGGKKRIIIETQIKFII